MDVGNYTYDLIGQLTSDADEDITSIEWTVTNKVKKIKKSDLIITFDYDPMGNRIAKHVTDNNGTVSTFYILDAQGNTMSVYEHKNAIISLEERNLYGSSRLGQEQVGKAMVANYSYINTGLFSNEIGDKRYELANHLGNVLQVITDRKLPFNSSNLQTNNSATAYYTADVVSYSDYYPYGMLMPNRHGSAATEYEYGFNGMRLDDEIKNQKGTSYDFGARMYDARVGRWFSRDAYESKYPFLSSYNFSHNNPLIFIDFDGRDIIIAFQGSFDGGGGSKIQCSEAGTTGTIVKEVLKQGWSEGRNDIKSLVFSNSFNVDPSKAFQEFEAIHKKDEKIIIYGYSYGGDAAVEFAEKLKTAGYSVDLLITVDAADGPLHGSTVDRTIPDNVKTNLNFYQGSHLGSGSRGDVNIADDPAKTNVINKKITNVNVNHGSIDEIVANRAIWYMESTLNLKQSTIAPSSLDQGGSSWSSSSSSSAESSFNDSSSSGSTGSSGSSSSSQGSSESESNSSSKSDPKK